MEIYIKTLSGGIQPISFLEKEVTISMLKKFTERSGYEVSFFREDFGNDGNNGNDGDDKKEEKSPLKDTEKVINGEMLNIFYKKEEFTENDNIKFENMLKDKLEKFYENFKSFIIKHKAVIAGGSVLSIFGDYDMKDLDIYVHYSEAKEFISSLFMHGCKLLDINQAPAYDDSFFRKNNIMCRCCMKYNSRFYESEEYYELEQYKKINIDIMIIPDHIEIESVVTNFDLTFCEVWWDGFRVCSNNTADIKSKCGYLKSDYIPSYIFMNSFTINRIQKYKNRGFTINIDMTNSHLLGTLTINNKKKKTINSCSDIWPEFTLFKYLLNHAIFVSNENDYFFKSSKKIFNYLKIYEKFKNRSQEEYFDQVYSAIVKCCYIFNKNYLTKDYIDIYKTFFSKEIEELKNISNFDFNSYESTVDEWVRSMCYEITQEYSLLTENRRLNREMYRNMELQ